MPVHTSFFTIQVLNQLCVPCFCGHQRITSRHNSFALDPPWCRGCKQLRQAGTLSFETRRVTNELWLMRHTSPSHQLPSYMVPSCTALCTAAARLAAAVSTVGLPTASAYP